MILKKGLKQKLETISNLPNTIEYSVNLKDKIGYALKVNYKKNNQIELNFLKNRKSLFSLDIKKIPNYNIENFIIYTKKSIFIYF